MSLPESLERSNGSAQSKDVESIDEETAIALSKETAYMRVPQAPAAHERCDAVQNRVVHNHEDNSRSPRLPAVYVSGIPHSQSPGKAEGESVPQNFLNDMEGQHTKLLEKFAVSQRDTGHETCKPQDFMSSSGTDAQEPHTSTTASTVTSAHDCPSDTHSASITMENATSFPLAAPSAFECKSSLESADIKPTIPQGLARIHKEGSSAPEPGAEPTLMTGLPIADIPCADDLLPQPALDPDAYTQRPFEDVIEQAPRRLDGDSTNTPIASNDSSIPSRVDSLVDGPLLDLAQLSTDMAPGVVAARACPLREGTAEPSSDNLLSLDDVIPDTLATPLLPIAHTRTLDLSEHAPYDATASMGNPTTDVLIESLESCPAPNFVLTAPEDVPLSATGISDHPATPASSNCDPTSSSFVHPPTGGSMSLLPNGPGYPESSDFVPPTDTDIAREFADYTVTFSTGATLIEHRLSGLDSGAEPVISNVSSAAPLPTPITNEDRSTPAIAVTHEDRGSEITFSVANPPEDIINVRTKKDSSSVPLTKKPLITSFPTNVFLSLEYAATEPGTGDVTVVELSQNNTITAASPPTVADEDSTQYEEPHSPGLPPSSPPCSQVSELCLPSSQHERASSRNSSPNDAIQAQDDSEADMDICCSQPTSSQERLFTSSPPLPASSPPTSPQLVPQDKGKDTEETTVADFEVDGPTKFNEESDFMAKKRAATDDLREELASLKRVKTRSYSPPPPPQPKRQTLQGQKAAYKKLVQPFRSPLVNIEDVLAGKGHVYASGRAHALSKTSVKAKAEPRDHIMAETSSMVEAGMTIDASSRPGEPVATRDRTARAGKPFKTLVIERGAPAASLGVKTGSTLQALQARVQKLKQAVKIKADREHAGDKQRLEALVSKWRSVGREVAWLVWDTVKDLDPGESLRALPVRSPWDDGEILPSRNGGQDYQSNGFKSGWGWDDGKSRGKGKGGFDSSWGWDDKRDGECEGETDGDAGENTETGEEEVQIMNHSLGTMLRHMGIDPDTLGWDEDEGDFVGEP